MSERVVSVGEVRTTEQKCGAGMSDHDGYGPEAAQRDHDAAERSAWGERDKAEAENVRLLAELVTLRADLAAANAGLPGTFYADEDFPVRVRNMTDAWMRAVSVNARLEEENESLRVELGKQT